MTMQPHRQPTTTPGRDAGPDKCSMDGCLPHIARRHDDALAVGATSVAKLFFWV